ncbi:ABC transporter permease [Streptomyces sp. RFCAC02]|uniref:ABC transporter permease n=1 Tax=Streptomyces sp. RFCAC02 TaxID=2499143 RepID=UPI001021EBC3|nr:ABC transporter permease [Streptomyces sp. RFCAC02]
MTVLRTSLRNVLAHKGRMALSGIAIVLSVAFVSGTLVFSDTLESTFDRFFASTTADVTVGPAEEENAQETGRDRTLPGAVVDDVRAVDGVAQAEGAVSTSSVTVTDAEGDDVATGNGAPTMGGDWGPSTRGAMELAEGRAPGGPGEAVLDADTAERAGVAIGDTLTVVAVPGTFEVEVTGLAAFTTANPGLSTVLLEPAAAREALLGSAGVISEVRVTAADGVSDAELAARITEALGADTVEARTAAQVEADLGDDVGFLDYLRYAMLGFAALAVLVGIFLIVNTFSMLVAQRTRELGLLRAVGASRRQVNRSVLVEALLLGVAGSVVGVGAGIGLAAGLLKLMSAAGVEVDLARLTVSPATPVAGLVVGVVTTVVSAWLPARRGGRVSPMAALREAGLPGDARTGRVRAVLGVVLCGAGAAALVVAAGAEESADGAPFLGAGVLLTLVGAVVVAPLLAGVVVRAVGAVVLRLFGTVGRMAGRNAVRDPRRTGATAGALMIGLALVGSLSVVGSSVVASASDQLDRTVGADFIVDTVSEQRITPEAADAVRAVPGIAHVTDLTSVNAEITVPGGAVADEELVAADPTYARDLRAEAVSGEPADAFGDDALSVGESFAEEHGLAVGDELTVRFVGGETVPLRLAAITSEDTLLDQGAMYVSLATVRAHLPADLVPLPSTLFVTADEGRAEAVHAALRDALAPYPQFEMRNQAEYKQLMEDQMGQLLNIVYALLALAIIVAILGVVNTLTLSVVERTREIGLMRAIGLSRRQLRRMVRLESVVIALFGALLGLGIGLAWGTAAQRVMAPSGFHVLDIPWATIGGVFAGSAVVGLVAALLPAFRAGRMNVLRAIATD